jgi:hypothetical protein
MPEKPPSNAITRMIRMMVPIDIKLPPLPDSGATICAAFAEETGGNFESSLGYLRKITCVSFRLQPT